MYWYINPWTDEFGRFAVYTGRPPRLLDTDLYVKPDTAWHSFELVADFANDRYISISVDGQTQELQADLAHVYHPEWQDDFAFIITAESMNAWPGGAHCLRTFGWSTRFRSMKLWKAATLP